MKGYLVGMGYIWVGFGFVVDWDWNFDTVGVIMPTVLKSSPLLLGVEEKGRKGFFLSAHLVDPTPPHAFRESPHVAALAWGKVG